LGQVYRGSDDCAINSIYRLHQVIEWAIPIDIGGSKWYKK